MNLKATFILLFLSATILLVGCYTKLSYHEPTYFAENQQKPIKRTDKEIENASDSEIEVENGDSEGYYGRRKFTYRSTRSYARDSYWFPYRPYPYVYYPSYMYYYPNPWYSGYYTPYGYYGSYYPYRGYYGRYRSTFHPTSRRTYKRVSTFKGLRSDYRRARYSRSLSSSTP